MQDEDEEEAPASNMGVEIVWYPKTYFDVLDTQLLFGYHFCLRSTIQKGGYDAAKKNMTWKSILTETTLNIIAKYANNYGSFNAKKWEDN